MKFLRRNIAWLSAVAAAAVAVLGWFGTYQGTKAQAASVPALQKQVDAHEAADAVKHAVQDTMFTQIKDDVAGIKAGQATAQEILEYLARREREHKHPGE